MKLVLDGSIQGFTAMIDWPGYFTGDDHGQFLVPPEQVVDLLRSTTHPLGDTSPLVQGAGLIDPVAAVGRALEMKKADDAREAAPAGEQPAVAAAPAQSQGAAETVAR